MATERIEKKSLNSPEEVRTFERGKMEVVKLGDHVVGRGTFKPGWKWSECVKPIAKTERCETPHFGYCVSGRMKVMMKDGTQVEYGPGDAAVIPPGHDAWIVGGEDCVFIDFTGADQYAKKH